MKRAILLPLMACFGLVMTAKVFSADPPASPATSAAVPATRTLSIEVSVLRFRPAKADRILLGFRDLAGNLTSVIEKLRTEGEVSVLYNATREVFLEDNSRAKFDALETRPIVLVGKAGAPLPPVTSYGLTLEIITRRAPGDQFGLSWSGNISWSPEVVDKWKGEKFLNFVSGAATVVRSASAFTGEGAKVNQGADIGLGLAQLFNPQGKPTENEIYELPVNKTVAFQSSRLCRSSEMLVNATTAEMGSKEAQTILLLIQPTLNPVL